MDCTGRTVDGGRWIVDGGRLIGVSGLSSELLMLPLTASETREDATEELDDRCLEN